MFRTLICSSSGACDYNDGLPHRLPCSVIVVCWGFVADDVWKCPFCRLKHYVLQPAKRTCSKHVEQILSVINITSDIKLVSNFSTE